MALEMREERLQDILSHSGSDWAQRNTTGEEDTFGFRGTDSITVESQGRIQQMKENSPKVWTKCRQGDPGTERMATE